LLDPTVAPLVLNLPIRKRSKFRSYAAPDMPGTITGRHQTIAHVPMPCVAQLATMMTKTVAASTFGMMNERFVFAD
jgi:hypothetical protein